MSLLAQKQIHGKDVSAYGPTFKNLKVSASSVQISFQHGKGLTTKDGKPARGFWVGDNHGKWIPAEASIKGESVTLTWKSKITAKFIRYAFAGHPDVNLVNKAGLPAMPFRTDHIEPKGYTDDAKEPGAQWRRK